METTNPKMIIATQHRKEKNGGKNTITINRVIGNFFGGWQHGYHRATANTRNFSSSNRHGHGWVAGSKKKIYQTTFATVLSSTHDHIWNNLITFGLGFKSKVRDFFCQQFPINNTNNHLQLFFDQLGTFLA